MWFSHNNQRVFNIKLGDKTVKANIDIIKEVGKYAAHTEYIEFELKPDNKIYFENILCKSAYKTSSKTLLLVFEKGWADNAKVNGIVLYKGPKSGKFVVRKCLWF